MGGNWHSLWQRVCDGVGVPAGVANEWLQKIQTRYDTEPQRFFHNSGLLELKCDGIALLDDGKGTAVPNQIILAFVFQYFHFDVKSDCSEKNAEAFAEFVNAAGIDGNVSI